MDIKYENLSTEKRSDYENRARSIIYVGLEPAYAAHDRMLSTLARALFKVDQLKLPTEIVAEENNAG